MTIAVLDQYSNTKAQQTHYELSYGKHGSHDDDDADDVRVDYFTFHIRVKCVREPYAIKTVRQKS